MLHEHSRPDDVKTGLGPTNQRDKDKVSSPLAVLSPDAKTRKEQRMLAFQNAIADRIMEKEGGLSPPSALPSFLMDDPPSSGGYGSYRPRGLGLGSDSVPSLRQQCVELILSVNIPYVGRGLSASVEAEVNDARVMMGYPNPASNAESAEAMKIKLVLLGADSVGKSCLCTALRDGVFPQNCLPTIGASFWQKTVCLGDQRANIQLWDTAGQERYDSLAPLYYKGAHAAVVLFEPSCRRSWEKAQFWVVEVQKKAQSEVAVFLGCTKMDLYRSSPSPSVPFEEVESFINERGVRGWMPLSARKQVNVNRFFVMIVTEVLAQQERKRSQPLKTAPSRPTQSARERFACRPWVPDDVSDSCTLCHTKFTLLFRRHHCRRCGRLCCSECSKQKARIPNHSKYAERPTRVCCKCFPSLAKLDINRP